MHCSGERGRQSTEAAAGALLPFSHALNGVSWPEDKTRLQTGYQDPCIFTICELDYSTTVVNYRCKLYIREAMDLTKQILSKFLG